MWRATLVSSLIVVAAMAAAALADGRQFIALTTLDGRLISLALPKAQ